MYYNATGMGIDNQPSSKLHIHNDNTNT